MSLTNKRKIFIDEYIKCFNAAESARKAGYSVRTARSIGQELLTKPDVEAAIKTRLEESHMGADEVLKLFADHARGDMGEFLDVSGMGFNLDLQEAKRRGLTKLIKKVKQKTTIFLAKKESEEDREVHELEIELYDAQAAGEKIGRHLKLFTDQVDVTTGGEKITLFRVVHDDDEKGDNGIQDPSPGPISPEAEGGDSQPGQTESTGMGPAGGKNED